MTMLTDEDLAEIKRKLNHRLATGDDMFRVILDIAERVRAESQLDRYREIVEAVANPPTPRGGDVEYCMFCEREPEKIERGIWIWEIRHPADCPVLKARALLADASDKREL